MTIIKVAHSHAIWLQQTETWLFNQIKYLNSSIEPHVVCREIRNLDQFKIKNIHQYHDPSFIDKWYGKILNTLNAYPCSIPFLKQLRKINPDILHSHFGHIGWIDMGAARRASLKHIVTFYGLDVNRLPTIEPAWKARYKTLFRHSDLVLCEGSFMAKSIIGLGCPDNKVKVHHLGVPVDEIEYRPRLWEKGQPLRILIAASFREKKGIPYALAAAGKIQDIVPLEITVIGDANEEPRSKEEKEKILAAIQQNKLSSKIRLLGYQPYAKLLKVAYEHHIFLAPSITARDGDTEGGAPVSLIEMAATGMPVVSSRHCDIPAIIRDGETGFLADERDVNGLAEKLEFLIRNPDQWTAVVERSRKHIENEYNASTQGEKLSRIYKEIVTQRIC